MRYRLVFNDYFTGDQQIDPLPFYNMSLVINIHFDLSLKRNSSELQFHT